jgi:hypothetical protein
VQCETSEAALKTFISLFFCVVFRFRKYVSQRGRLYYSYGFSVNVVNPDMSAHLRMLEVWHIVFDSDSEMMLKKWKCGVSGL